jgi:tricarboxylate carrier
MRRPGSTAAEANEKEPTPKATSPVGGFFSSASEFFGGGGDTNVAPFSLDGERYDQTTYYGRFRKMLDVTDLRTLLCSKQEINAAVDLLKDFEEQQKQPQHQRQKEKQPVDDAALWEAKKIKDAIFHPDTNEPLPMPFRMSGFLPFNAPVCVGALMARSTPSVFFFHWTNQTHNALINYHNRNATQPLDMSTILRSYLGAAGGAVGVAMGLQQVIQRSKRLTPAQKIFWLRFSALPGIVTAAAINVLLMRVGELSTGIDVYYEEEPKSAGEKPNEVVVGPSQLAAQKAMKEMVISRMVLPFPVFLMVPVCMSLAGPLVRKNPRLDLPFQSIFTTVGFALGLPAACALFPQVGTVDAASLEDKFQHLRDADGKPLKVFKYNKGL